MARAWPHHLKQVIIWRYCSSWSSISEWLMPLFVAVSPRTNHLLHAKSGTHSSSPKRNSSAAAPTTLNAFSSSPSAQIFEYSDFGNGTGSRTWSPIVRWLVESCEIYQNIWKQNNVCSRVRIVRKGCRHPIPVRITSRRSGRRIIWVRASILKNLWTEKRLHWNVIAENTQ